MASAFLLGALICPSALFAGETEKAAEALAVVGGKEIPSSVLQEEMRRGPGRVTTEEEKAALLEMIIRRELIHAAALKEGYAEDPEIMAGIRRLIINKYRSEHLEPRLAGIRVTDGEIEDYYQKNQADFAVPASVRTAVIRVSVPGKASDEKKAVLLKRMEEARAAALDLGPETRSFGSVAVKYSDDQTTRYRGGDTGWLRLGESAYRWDEAVVEAIFSLKDPGQVSSIVTTPVGYYVVKLMEAKDASFHHLATVSPSARRVIGGKKRAELEKQFYDELAGNIPVSIDEDLLRSIPLPKEGAPGAIKPPPLPGQ